MESVIGFLKGEIAGCVLELVAAAVYIIYIFIHKIIIHSQPLHGIAYAFNAYSCFDAIKY